MRQDHGGCVAVERELDDLARVDAGLLEGAAKQDDEVEQAVLGIKQGEGEDLVGEVGQVQAHEIAGGIGLIDD